MLKVSVIILTCNSQGTLKRCLCALLDQSYRDFELVLVDDFSTDKTIEIINSFDDDRIRLVQNANRMGIAKSRNIGLEVCKGSIVFFTDSDCIPTLNWLEQGVQNIGRYDIITGWTLYEAPRPTFKDRVVDGKDDFFTCNLGFKKKAIHNVGGFDADNFPMYFEDKDLCFRILKNGGKKIFCKNMIVIHQQNIRSPRDELKRYSNYYCGKLASELRHKNEVGIFLRIIRPFELLYIFCPFLLLFVRSFRSFYDIKLVPYTWIGLMIGRLHMWKKCIELKVFYI